MLYGFKRWTLDIFHKESLSTKGNFWQRAARTLKNVKIRNSTVHEIMDFKQDVLQTIKLNILNDMVMFVEE